MEFLQTTTVCGITLYDILAYFLIYSCLGWCTEVVYAAVTTGKLVNRGFLNGPVCPIYGFGMIGVVMLLVPLQEHVVLLYIGGVILPSAVELVGGWVLYKLYHTRWWDYTDRPFNIGGYVCLQFSLLWGVGTLIMVKIIHPIVDSCVDMVPGLIGFVVMSIMYACYAADVIATAFEAAGLARDLEAMEKVADSMHAVSDAMTQLLGTTAMDADRKMDEQRLQLKLAAAEAKNAAAQRSQNSRDAAAAMRAKAEEAMDTALRVSQEAKLNAVEAANAAKLAAQGKAERAAELVHLEELAEELKLRSREMHRNLLHAPRIFGKRRLLRAFPQLKHGDKGTTLSALREKLELDKVDKDEHTSV